VLAAQRAFGMGFAIYKSGSNGGLRQSKPAIEKTRLDGGNMSIQKKSLINNLTAAKKAIIATSSTVTPVVANKAASKSAVLSNKFSMKHSGVLSNKISNKVSNKISNKLSNKVSNKLSNKVSNKVSNKTANKMYQ
jgi:hypothetical protein